jgi:hypothetical protein
MTGHDRVYALLLRAYPARFRAAYGREMLLVVRDQRRERGPGGAGLWLEILLDVARSAPPLRLDDARARWTADLQRGEGTMKPMAMLAVLVGVLEAANAMVEVWAGAIVNHDIVSLLSAGSAVLAALLLAGAGVLLLRGSPGASARAQGAAVLCLVVFGAIARLRLSVASTLLGVVFPIALLVYLRMSGGRRPSAPTMA